MNALRKVYYNRIWDYSRERVEITPSAARSGKVRSSNRVSGGKSTVPLGYTIVVI
jgi:hypothetical protein